MCSNKSGLVSPMGKAELPFGKPFKYTETLEFSSERKPWYRRLFSRKKKLPAAWLVAEEARPVAAYMMKRDDEEIRVSPVEPEILTPIYDEDFAEDLFIAAAEGLI
jgi:hypothetical protein